MRTEEPRAIHLADYQAPEFHIITVQLDFALGPETTRVRSRLEIERRDGSGPLVLQGEEQKLLSVTLDGRSLSIRESGAGQNGFAGGYLVDGKSLTIPGVPDRGGLEVVSEMSAAGNRALEGLCVWKGMCCTQW